MLPVWMIKHEILYMVSKYLLSVDITTMFRCGMTLHQLKNKSDISFMSQMSHIMSVSSLTFPCFHSHLIFACALGSYYQGAVTNAKTNVQ